MKATRYCTMILSVLATTGCVTQYSHTVAGDFDPSKRQVIEAEDTGVGVLALTTPELDVSAKLRARCQDGRVSGAESVATMRNFVLVQFYVSKAKAFCEPVVAPAAAPEPSVTSTAPSAPAGSSVAKGKVWKRGAVLP